MGKKSPGEVAIREGCSFKEYNASVLLGNCEISDIKVHSIMIGFNTFFHGNFPEAQMETILVFLTVVFICFCLTIVSLVAITGKQETAAQALQVLLSGLRSFLSKMPPSAQ